MKTNKKGVVLIISLMVIAVLLVLTGAYFSSLLTEKRSADTEKFVLQALGLAEAGANHGLAELRARIRNDLNDNLGNTTEATVNANLLNYASATLPNPLGLLGDYANFTVLGTNATVAITPVTLGVAWGNYTNTTVTVTPAVITPCSANPTLLKPVDVNCTQNCRTVDGGAGCVSEADIYHFYYNYSISSTGEVTTTTPATTKTVSLTSGSSFTVTVHRGNFAKYALFTNHHRTPSDTTVWFTASTNFTGPVHTNDRFNFANNPSAHFTESVTQHLTKANFYHCGLLDADTCPSCCELETCLTTLCLDKPIFDAGFTRGVEMINLPSSVTQKDLKDQATGGQNDGHWSDGIYLPKDSSNNLVGGIYIKGNTSNLTMSVESGKPVYTITQGSNTKKITLDYGDLQNPNDDQTIVTNVSGSGGTPGGTYNGIPNGTTNKGIIIYDNGSISNFSGTVQQDTQATVSSDSDISINNHIMYQSYTPDDLGTTLQNELSAAGYTNLLGILTWNGNVRITTSAPDNLNIHGVVMAAGRNGVFTVNNYASGSPRGVVTLLGGVITDFYGPFGTFSGTGPISGYGRNFVYDGRMLQGMSPPSFPTTTGYDSSEGDSDDDGVKDLDERLIWQDKGV